MSEIISNGERDVQTGRFLPGNAGNGGRKPGQRYKLGEAFLFDLRRSAYWRPREGRPRGTS